MKTCTKCGETKPFSEYAKHKLGRDGLRPRCKACTAEDNAPYRARTVEQRAEYNRVYRLENRDQHVSYNSAWNKANRDRIDVAVEKWRKKNPEKIAAHVKVSQAVKAGVLVRPTSCEDCGSAGVIHGHHEDYSRPLDVQWLCPRCHCTRRR